MRILNSVWIYTARHGNGIIILKSYSPNLVRRAQRKFLRNDIISPNTILVFLSVPQKCEDLLNASEEPLCYIRKEYQICNTKVNFQIFAHSDLLGSSLAFLFQPLPNLLHIIIFSTSQQGKINSVMDSLHQGLQQQEVFSTEYQKQFRRLIHLNFTGCQLRFWN